MLEGLPQGSESLLEGFDGLSEGLKGSPLGLEDLLKRSESLQEKAEGLPEGSNSLSEGLLRGTYRCICKRNFSTSYRTLFLTGAAAQKLTQHLRYSLYFLLL